MSSLLFQASITTLLLLFPFLSFSAVDELVDIYNGPIVNGGYYYIIPISYNEDSYLTYIYKDIPCLFYITPHDYRGTPVKISGPLETHYIMIDTRVSLSFIRPSECVDLLVWGRRVVDPLTKKVYITTGGVERDWSFSITKTGKSWGPFYQFKYWPSSDDVDSADVGLDKSNRFLGLNLNNTVYVTFKKAYGDNLELSTSS